MGSKLQPHSQKQMDIITAGPILVHKGMIVTNID